MLSEQFTSEGKRNQRAESDVSYHENTELKDNGPAKTDDERQVIPVQEPALRDILSADKKLIVSGLLWFAVGTAVTIYTYTKAASSPYGGTYLVMWGAIGWGLWDFLRGLGWYFWHKTHPVNSKLAVQTAFSNNVMPVTDEKVCRYCKHTVPAGLSMCPNCSSDVSI